MAQHAEAPAAPGVCVGLPGDDKTQNLNIWCHYPWLPSNSAHSSINVNYTVMNKGRHWKPSMNSRRISVFPVGSCIPLLSWYPVPPVLPLPPCSLPRNQRFHSSWFQFLAVILGPMILKGSFQSLSTPQLSIGHSDIGVGQGKGPVCPARCEQSCVQGTWTLTTLCFQSGCQCMVVLTSLHYVPKAIRW